jgi:hypothetical protein
MSISTRSVCPDSLRRSKLNSIEPPRYGPVCQVVWEGRRREAPPYPDQWVAGLDRNSYLAAIRPKAAACGSAKLGE